MTKINVADVEYRLKEFIKNHYDDILRTVFIIAVCVFGIILRYKLFPQMTKDMNSFLIKWYNYLKSHGGFAAVGDKIGDYTPMYYYLLAALTYIKLPIHVGIKLISCFFDFLLAIYVMKIVQIKDAKKSFYSAIAFAVAFCLPTVVLNSGAWGQCDVIYTSFLIMGLYYILKGNDRVAMIMIGISFSFKLQAIFIAPLIGILVMRKKIRWRMLLWIPIAYFISIIPALLAGGNLIRLLTVYIQQSGHYKWLTAKLPNIWMLLGNGFINKELSSAGVYFAAIIVLCFMYYYVSKKDMKITPNVIVGIAVLSSFIVPFVLPHMHERYMYFTEIMFVIFAFYYRKRAWLLATTQFCSVQGLLMYLYKVTMMDMRLFTFLWIVNATVAFYALRDEINNPIEEDELIMKFELQKS